jgi:ribokinase
MSKPVVVVGSINLDLVAAAEKIPVAGETVIGSQFRTFPGGKGANQAVAAARLGAEVCLIGKLGSDPFGEQLRAGLQSSGVNTDCIGEANCSSGVALIVTGADGNNSITVVPGANGELRAKDVLANIALLRRAGMVLAQLEIPLETVECVAEICGQNGIPFMLDPAPAKPLPASVMRRVTYLTPNEIETCSLLEYAAPDLPEESLEGAAAAFLGHGCENVILKLGARGCYVRLTNGTRKRIPGFKVSAVDTTAAGDAFNGAFAVASVAGKGPFAAAEWASAVAAISVTRPGAQPSMPSSREVEAFLIEKGALATQV